MSRRQYLEMALEMRDEDDKKHEKELNKYKLNSQETEKRLRNAVARIEELEHELAETKSFLKEVVDESKALRDHIRGPILPMELLHIVADLLLSSHHFGTFASLCTVSNLLHETFSPMLFKTMVCDTSWRFALERNAGGKQVPRTDPPLETWKATKSLIVSRQSRILENRHRFFPNLELGLNIYRAPLGHREFEHGADLIICKPVTMDAIAKLVDIPLWYDQDGNADAMKYGFSGLRKVEYISAIKFECHGAILPSTSPSCPYDRKHPLLKLELDFGEGYKKDGFSSTLEQAFKFALPMANAEDDESPLVALVVVKMQDGWEGLKRFVKALKHVLRNHPTCSIKLELVVHPDSLLLASDEENPPQLTTEVDQQKVEFAATMKAVGEIYRKYWPGIKKNRRGEPTADERLFKVEIKLGGYPTTRTERPTWCYRGFVEGYGDEEEDGGEVALWVEAKFVEENRTETELYQERYMF